MLTSWFLRKSYRKTNNLALYGQSCKIHYLLLKLLPVYIITGVTLWSPSYPNISPSYDCLHIKNKMYFPQNTKPRHNCFKSLVRTVLIWKRNWREEHSVWQCEWNDARRRSCSAQHRDSLCLRGMLSMCGRVSWDPGPINRSSCLRSERQQTRRLLRLQSHFKATPGPNNRAHQEVGTVYGACQCIPNCIHLPACTCLLSHPVPDFLQELG
jgi:hypothetical protein